MSEGKSNNWAIVASGFTKALSTTLVYVFSALMVGTIASIGKYDDVWYQVFGASESLIDTFKNIILVGILVSSLVLSYSVTRSVLSKWPRALSVIASTLIAWHYMLFITASYTMFSFPIRQFIKATYGIS